jgi:endonuclease/exonuclease/phosphatase family metal-dependent hydrolase
VLIRSWNLFHGNTVPAGRSAHLGEMLARTAADGIDVLCAQEVPASELQRFACASLASRPAIGPFPIPTGLGRRLTTLHNGVLRSAFAGQGNAIVLGPGFELLSSTSLVLNPRGLRDREALRLGLGAWPRLAWAHERRTVHAARVRAPDGRTMLIANAHCTAYRPDLRLAGAELLRAARFARSTADTGDIVVLAGDFNVTLTGSAVLRSLCSEKWGFSAAGPGIDHVLVHGAASTALRVLPDEWRRYNDTLLSDHAPVEVEIE